LVLPAEHSAIPNRALEDRRFSIRLRAVLIAHVRQHETRSGSRWVLQSCAEEGSDFDLYRSLFEQDAERRELCVNHAPFFFADFSRIITRALVLPVCKLTDPAGSGKRTNLTMNYIVKKLCWSENVKTDPARLNDLLACTRFG
jgi:hypothetical protein